MFRSSKALVFLAMLHLAGCSANPWNIQQVMLSSGALPVRTPPEKIEIFRERGVQPTGAHVEIAQLSIREKGIHAPTLQGQSIEATLSHLKARASELGADAIKEVNIYVAKTGTVGAGSVSIDGVAIRWK